ncbi:MAG TPA: hypothetical protein VG759_28340 [Candidatus Angelobacter sp.]|jgi:hypothetical protein|nr:hypothetical protein [Candidatus Angelobacter sp.]
MRRVLQFTVIFSGVLFFIGLTTGFGQTADPNKEANQLISSPSASYPRVPGTSIVTGPAQPASASPTLVFPANATTSRAALTTKTSGAAKSNSGSASSNTKGSNSKSDDSDGDNRAAQGKIRGATTVPVFTGVFAQGFNDFPFIMMGRNPALGGTTVIPAKITTVSLQLLNPDGTLRASLPYAPFEDLTLDSPNFEEANYASGRQIQFTDAVQRAEFFNSMGDDWHTVLHPTVVDRVTNQVPRFVNVQFPDGSVKSVQNYFVGTAADGEKFIFLLDLFFNFINTNTVVNEINANNFTTNALNLAVYPNTFLFSIDNQGNIASCCTLGFHTFFADTTVTPAPRWVFGFASWMAPGVFSGGAADITPLSHEITEAVNDPFVDNFVPVWQFPGIPGACQNTLETGDPVEVLPNSVVNVTIRERHEVFTFHPQTEALLQWFEQLPTSDALGGAFSFPDTTALPHAATPCF